MKEEQAEDKESSDTLKGVLNHAEQEAMQD